jgi:hypothetical protein
MTTPTITLYPDTLPAKGQANAAFDTNVDNFLTWQTVTSGPELAAMITWTVGVRDSVLAAALAGDLPPLTGEALKVPRANATEDGVEFATVTQASWDLLDDANAAAQRVTLGVAADSADEDLAVEPDGALRRDIAVLAIAAAIASSAPGTPSFVLEDQKASGTAGQTSSTSWAKTNLNTEVLDPDGLVSITSDEFTVTKSGWVEYTYSFFRTSFGQLRLYDVTSSAVVSLSINAVSIGSAGAGAGTTGVGAVVAGRTYRIEAQSNAAIAGGLGLAASFGTEVYGRVTGYLA